MFARSAVIAATLLVAQTAAGAQSAAEHIALGDREHAALNAAAALTHYQAAVKADSLNYEALWKASRDAVDVGEYTADKKQRTAMYADAKAYARRAVEANANDAEGHFQLARALGRAALTLGPRDRIKYANDVRSQALEALRLDPKHPGALHVMGVWNAEVMRLSGATRWIAKNLLGGKVFKSASWANAVRYMEESVAVDPDRPTHHLDLAKIYADVGDKAKAREQYEIAARLAPRDPNDAARKQEAERLLAKS